MKKVLSSDNGLIAKNTVALYIKLIISIIVNFITIRLVMDALGASDYGLYCVVSGIVLFLNMLGAAMLATSYRYMAVEIGKGNNGDANKVYNTVLLVHVFISILLIVLGETLGVFYVKNYLNVDSTRISDALFVLHFTIVTCVASILTVPVNGLIIAKEKFVLTSLVEIISQFLKIGFVIVLLYMDVNKLRYYTILVAVCQLFIPVCYQIYCLKNEYQIIKWKINKKWADYRDVLTFAWWIFVGAFSSITKGQVSSLIINYYYGTVLNASYGIANQVYSATTQFTSTLRQAVVPQIMKGQSSGDEGRALNLVYTISRYSYLFMLVPAIPLILCINGALEIWLGAPPAYTSIFIVLMLVNGMIGNLSAGFDAQIQASGNIRKNQIGFTIINLLLLPAIFIFFRFGFPPYISIVIYIIGTIILLVFQCGIMKEITSFSIKHYVLLTIKPSIITTVIAFVPLLFLIRWFNQSTLNTIIGGIICIIWTCVAIYAVGFNKKEKDIIRSIVLKK